MPLFSLDIEKQWGAEYWTNRYMINAADLAAAKLVAPSVLAAERAVHHAGILFTKYRVSDSVPGNEVYSITTVNQEGQVAAAVTSLPLFNCARVDFNPASGRPSRKYLRLPVYEADQDQGTFSTAFITFLNSNYVQAMLAIAAFHDVDDQPFTSGNVHPLVAMRQLRRGSKRKTTPVLP